MDIEKLIEAVKLCGSTPKVDQCKQCAYWSGGDMSQCIPRMTADCATAITALFARAEAAEATGMWQSDLDAAKRDAGKPRLSLVPPQIIFDIAQVREYGNRKYGSADNWKEVELQRYIDALYRHMLAFVEDNRSRDAESDIEHYKHMACNMAFICQLMKQTLEEAELK